MERGPHSERGYVLALLHIHLTKGKIEGLRPGTQVRPVIIAFPNRNPDVQNKSAWPVELMLTVFIINRPYRTTTPKKRQASDMEDEDQDEEDDRELIHGDVGIVIQAGI